MQSSIACRFGTGSAPGNARQTGHVFAVLGRAVLDRAAAEHLRPRLQVHVDLEPDHGLPAAASHRARPSPRGRRPRCRRSPRPSRAAARARRASRSATARARPPRAAASASPTRTARAPSRTRGGSPKTRSTAGTNSAARSANRLNAAAPARCRSRSPARGRGRRGRACSPRTAARSAAGRREARPTSPHGIESPGRPATHDGIVSRSEAYIASGSATRSPIRNATVGEVGETSTSKRSNTSSCSRLITVRTFCAVP